MNFFKNLKKYLALVLASTAGLMNNTYAALPTAYGGASAPTNGNWFDLIKNYISEGGDLIGLGLTILAFIVSAYYVMAKVGEARKGKAEWAEVGVTAGIGAAAVILIGFFADQAATVI